MGNKVLSNVLQFIQFELLYNLSSGQVLPGQLDINGNENVSPSPFSCVQDTNRDVKCTAYKGKRCPYQRSNAAINQRIKNGPSFTLIEQNRLPLVCLFFLFYTNLSAYDMN